MEFLYERVAYLRGLADGLEIGQDTKEGKLLLAMLDVLEDMADAIAYMDESNDELDDSEEYVYEYDCPNCGNSIEIDEGSMELEEQIICPKCNEPIQIAIHCECDE